ncbi:Zinc finger BED domain-containing protein RICESLEEPER 2 [Glycine soja]|uniref:Zinc finger BED domain-containing protein RICESLEEPER 2 n=1 Tax=Glycine soja TaxID=3848 RepID=A0A445G809_GLYSO|nr:Zinc finger BED domain-containing protein RICESLEEPER 2 [Glycine soja]
MNVNNLYDSEKKKIKCMLSKVPSKISLTSDVWTSCTSADPRFKIKLLKYCYSKLGLDPISCQAKLKVVEHKLYTLYNEYVQMYSKETKSNFGLSQGSSQETMATTSTISIAQVDVMDEFIQFEDEDMSQVGKSQLDTYLEEANLSNKYHPNLDVLQYWKDNQARFPDLSLLACDILSIQITMVASESTFSIGSRLLNKYRTTLFADNVQALICTKNWLLGFDMQGKEDEDVEMEKAQTTSNMESFVVGDV